MSYENLAKMFAKADRTDIAEGKLAYSRYRKVMAEIAAKYDVTIERTTAAFVAMSPNNDYSGNLRSLVSVLSGFRRGLALDRIAVSSYGHCKVRAMQYIRGEADFLSTVKGLKIRAFYHNILWPHDTRHVTVDGHMVCAWRAQNLTMKQALVRGPRTYRAIEADTKQLAFRNFLVPCEMQAIIWFVRKRTANVVYDPQMELFGVADDLWKTHKPIDEIQPYGLLSDDHIRRNSRRAPELEQATAFGDQGAGESLAGRGRLALVDDDTAAGIAPAVRPG